MDKKREKLDSWGPAYGLTDEELATCEAEPWDPDAEDEYDIEIVVDSLSGEAFFRKTVKYVSDDDVRRGLVR
jgi:hypothetical protein